MGILFTILKWFGGEFSQAVLRKFFADNLPNLHWKNITSFIAIWSFILLANIVTEKHILSLSRRLLRLHKKGIIVLEEKVRFALAMCVIILPMLKNIKFTTNNSKSVLLLNPANYSQPNNY